MSETTATKTVRKPRILPVVVIFIFMLIAGVIANPFYFDGIAYVIVTTLAGFIFITQGIFFIWTVIQIVRRVLYHAPKANTKKVVKTAKIVSLFLGGK